MARLHRFFRGGLATLALSAGSATTRADQTARLPVEGWLTGEVKLAALPDLGLAWRVEAKPDGITLSATSAGADLVVALRPGEAGVWHWELRRGAVDLAELWPLLRTKLGAAAQGWSASGRVELAGAGTWSAEAGPAGELSLALREGWARSDALDMEVSGIELDVVTHELAGGAVLPARQSLRVAKVAAAGAEVGPLRMVFGLDAARVLEVAEAEAKVLGGNVRLRPFRVPLDKPAVDAAADVDALRLDLAARLMPWLIQSAQGILRGRVELSWDVEKGLRMRDGGLRIVKADDASFRLAPSPGLLTKKIPKRFSLLPWRWARWISIDDPAHEPLKEIEEGREGLRIETFEVEFRPDGAGQGRTAAIHIVGRPTSGKLVEKVTLDVNFHGPWSELLAFGLNNDLSGFSFRFE